MPKSPKDKKDLRKITNLIQGKKKGTTIADLLSNMPLDDLTRVPEHKWDGTKLSFEDGDGNWGLSIDLKGEKGDKGERGGDGYTPKKGVDYFTPEEINYIIKEITPEDGKDGKDADEEIIIEEVTKKVNKNLPTEQSIITKVIKQLPQNKEIKEIKPKDLIEAIKKLKGDERIPLSAIKGSEFLMKLGSQISGGGASVFTQLSDVPDSYSGEANKVVSVKADESGLEFTTGGGGTWGTITGTLSDQTDLQSALDAKALNTTKLDDWTTPDDNTDLNATTSYHGLLPKLGGGTTNFLRADGTWAEPPGASGGEANTASNVGSAGTGIFKQKTGVDLEFYKLNSINSLLLIALDGTDKVDFTVDNDLANYSNANSNFTSSSAVITDNSIVRGDGGSRGLQSSGITIDDNDVIAGVASLGLDTGYSKTGSEPLGSLYWNSTEDTLDLVQQNGVINQLGTELNPLYRNNTGVAITNGTPVMFSGSVGASGIITIQKAIADGSIPAFYTLGIVTEDIANGDDGHVTWFGKVRMIDTSGTPYGEVWSDGDIIYISPTTAGYLTNVKPDAPNEIIPIAAVVYAHNVVGELMVRPTWSEKLTDLADVNGTALTTSGQIPIWDNANSYFDFTDNINNYLRLDQTTPQTIINGIPLTDWQLTDFVSGAQLVNKEYVDQAVNFIDTFYFNNTASDIGGIYYNMEDMSTGEAESSFVSGSLGQGNGQALYNFATISNVPGVDILKAGIYSTHFHAKKDLSGSKPVKIYAELYTRTSGGSETLRSTSEISDYLTDASLSYDLHFNISSDVTINTTDRIIIKFLANVEATGTNVIVTLYAEGTNSSRIEIPTTTEVLSSVFVRQDGTKTLTANWDAGSWKITAETFESDVATGTAPLIVASTTKVANLNVDLLDDQSGAYYLDSANFTGTNWTDLTDTGATTLHKHSHTILDDIGTNTHAQIDTHIADSTIHFTQAAISITASQVSDFDTEVANNTAVAANTAKVTNATHTGEVTGATALTIADNVVDEANLKVNTPTNGYVLTADSGEAGGMKWAVASGGGISWSEVTGTSQSMAVNTGYILNNAALVTATLPATASVGDVVRVTGKGAGGWSIAQNSGQTIHFGNTDTTTGVGGSLASTNTYDGVELVCITANTDWVVISSVGNITIV